jgi:hypothetical protein
MGYGNVDVTLAKLSMNLRVIDTKLSDYNLDLVGLLDQYSKVDTNSETEALIAQNILDKKAQINVCSDEQKRCENAILDYVRKLAAERLVNNG